MFKMTCNLTVLELKYTQLLEEIMNKIVDVVKWSFKFSKEYMTKSVNVQHAKYEFEQTLTEEQKAMFQSLLDENYSLQNVAIDEYIEHTYNVCKEVFKLR